MLTELTPEQEALIPVIKNKWLDRIFGNRQPVDREKAVFYTKWLYKLCVLKEPLIIFMDSPMALQIGANIFFQAGNQVENQVRSQIRSQAGGQIGDQVREQVWDRVRGQIRDRVGNQIGDRVGDQVRGQVWGQVRDQVGDQVEEQVREQIWGQIESQIWDQVESQVGGQVKSQIKSQVWGQVWEQVESQVGEQVRDQIENQVENQVGNRVENQVGDQIGDRVREQVGDQIRSQVWGQVKDLKEIKFYNFNIYGNITDYEWISFYNFFEEIEILKNDNFINFRKLIETNIFLQIQTERVCLICGMPEILQRDDKGRLHSLSGPAIAWKDGYGQYYINGVPFDYDKWFKFTSDKMDAIEIMCEDNQDKKRVMIMNYENEKLIRELRAVEKSREKDNQGNDMVIWEIPQKDDDPMIFYEGVCPSKMEKIYLRLPPEYGGRRPIEGKIWSFPLLRREYAKTGKIPELTYET